MESKKEFRRRVNIVCALMFCCFGANLVISYFYSYLTVFNVPTSFWIDTFAVQAVYMVLYAVPIFLIAYKTCHEEITELLPVKSGEAGQKILAVIGSVGAGMVLNIIYGFVLSYLEEAGVEIAEWDAGLLMPETGAEWIGYGVMVCVFPAVLEELVFRGAILGCLKKINTPAAVIISALLFGLYHGTIEQIPVTFGLGLILGWLCVRFDSILMPMAFHFVNNLIATVQTFLLEALPEETSMIVVSLLNVVLFVVGLAVFCVIAATGQMKTKRQDMTENGEAILSGKAAFVATVSSVLFWIFTAFTIVSTLLNNYMLTR